MFKKVLLSEIGNEDLNAKRNEYYFALPDFITQKLLPMLNDERDIVYCHLLFNIFTISYPIFIYILWFLPTNPTKLTIFLSVLAIVVQGIVFLSRFILMLHFSTHKPMFKDQFFYLNYIIPYFVGPFFGFLIGIYNLHHAVMHHQENNSRLDITETETYQRDSIKEYIRYNMTFIFGFFIYLPIYAIVRKRYLLCLNHMICMYYSFWVYKYFHHTNPIGAFIVFGIPTLFNFLALSFGNWSQHIFVTPEKSQDNYNLAYNIINDPSNQATFNDGYHISHHINSTVHWGDLPKYFMDNQDKYAKNGAIVFRGLTVFHVGVYVMTGQWKKLASHYVFLDEEFANKSTEDSLIEMFKSRCTAVKKKRFQYE
jgi:hypothetical protein